MTHVLRYLLIFGDRKKKVELTVSQEIENVKVETLKQKAKELFNLKNVILQIWDKGFEDWVDLDEGDPTPTNSRIKVEIDKEARSLADIAIAQRRTSSVPGASPTVVLSAKKPDPPVLQVISSQPAYPPVALATTGVSLLTGAPQSFPPVPCLPSNSQTVSAKPSSGVPQKILPVGQRPYRGEQSPGSKTPGRGASSSSVGKLTVNLGDVQDDRNTTPRACPQPYPSSGPYKPQDRSVLDYVQESFSLSSTQSPDRFFPPSQEDMLQRIVTSHPQNETLKEEVQGSLLECSNDKLSLSDYKLPKFPESLVRKLKNGIILKTGEVSVLLDKLYESVVPYTYYPTPSDYLYLTGKLLDQFPQLIQQSGLIKDCTDKWEIWRQKLIHKFQNKRKRQDRDALSVLQRKRMKHFGDLDEHQSVVEEGQHGAGDVMDSDDDVDDEVFEVQAVVIKEEEEEEEESMYHVMPADTTNQGDTPDIGVPEECHMPPPNTQTSGISEERYETLQGRPSSQQNLLQHQDSHVRRCTQIIEHVGKEFLDDLQGSCSSKQHMQASGSADRNMPHPEDHSRDKVSNTHLQNRRVLEVEQQLGSSGNCGHTSKISRCLSPLSQDKEEGVTEVQIIESTSCTYSSSTLHNYKLPEFPADIVLKLKKGIPIRPRDRSILLNTLYESVVPYTYYPSSAHYNYLTNIFLERYPQLLHQSGELLNCSDKWEIWRQKLMHKFKNRRKQQQDRDAQSGLQHKVMNYMKHFGDLDEPHSVVEECQHGTRDVMHSDDDVDDGDEVFEVQAVVIKEEEEESMYHVMPADTTNRGDTPDTGVPKECPMPPPDPKISRIPEELDETFQIQPSSQQSTSQQQDSHVRRCTQINEHVGKEFLDDLRGSCSSKQHMQASGSSERNMLHPEDHSQDKVSNTCLHNRKVLEVEQQLGSSGSCGHTSKFSRSLSPLSQDKEEGLTEVQIIKTSSWTNTKPLRHNYKLPEFPVDIILKLKKGIPIRPRDKSILLNTLYESVVPYTYYPSSEEYTYLTNVFLERYPQLLPQDCSDTWETWRQKLMRKFKNRRKLQQDRDAQSGLQCKIINYMKHFGGLDEHQSVVEEGLHGTRDVIDSDDDDGDDEVFEVKPVVIKKEEEEESLYHVMPADTTNQGDTQDTGVPKECHMPPPNTQTSRIQGELDETFPSRPSSQQSTSQQQDIHLQGSCSSKQHPEDHSQDKVSNTHLQNQRVVEVEQQFGSLGNWGHTSTISRSSSPLSLDKEEGVTEVQIIKSTSCTYSSPTLHNYKLPEFPADIILKLKKGIPIKPRDRSILLGTLYESVVPYTYYPSSADYNYLTNIFLERYPQLLPQSGELLNCSDTWETWRQKLMHKFKNRRKRRDRDALAVKEHSREHTRKDFQFYEGIKELQRSMNEREKWISSDCPIDDDDDEIFEIMDDEQEVISEGEHSKKHVRAADTADIVEVPDEGVVHIVQKSTSSSLPIQNQGISERVFPPTQDIAFPGSTFSHPKSKSAKDIFQEPSVIPKKNVPFPQDNAAYLLADAEPRDKPVIDSLHSQACIPTPRFPEGTLPPFQAGSPAAAAEENFSPNALQGERQTIIPSMESTSSSLLHKPCLYDYKLPEFPSDILRKLKLGISIESRDRSVLLDVLYESIVPYTYYPTSSDYTFFTNIFLEQFPQLLPQAGYRPQNCSNNWEAWKQKLMHKFKNKRKRQDRDAPGVKEQIDKKVRYVEALDELLGTSGQDAEHRMGAVNINDPNEADDDVDDDIFEIADVAEDIVIKKEEQTHHMMPADTTDSGDVPEMS